MRLAALASMSLFASASGDYVSMFVERGNVPAFPGTTTYRIFATFDDPGDKVIALAGLVEEVGGQCCLGGHFYFGRAHAAAVQDSAVASAGTEAGT